MNIADIQLYDGKLDNLEELAKVTQPSSLDNLFFLAVGLQVDVQHAYKMRQLPLDVEER